VVVVEGGNVLHHVNREEELSGRENIRKIYPAEYVQGKYPDPRNTA